MAYSHSRRRRARPLGQPDGPPEHPEPIKVFMRYQDARSRYLPYIAPYPYGSNSAPVPPLALIIVVSCLVIITYLGLSYWRASENIFVLLGTLILAAPLGWLSIVGARRWL